MADSTHMPISTAMAAESCASDSPESSSLEADARDFRTFFASEGAFVLRIVKRLGIRDSDVADVAQEVFVIAHRRMPDWDRNVPARSWLYGIVRRVVANALRTRRRRLELSADGPDARACSAPSPHDDLTRQEARVLLDRALSTLDHEKREVLVLFELEELPMTEIAQLIGCSLSNAYARLYAARDDLRRAFVRAELKRKAT